MRIAGAVVFPSVTRRELEDLNLAFNSLLAVCQNRSNVPTIHSDALISLRNSAHPILGQDRVAPT